MTYEDFTLYKPDTIPARPRTNGVSFATAPAGGLTVTLSGSRSGLATVPPAVTVPAGQSTAIFVVRTKQTASTRGVLLRAIYGAQARVATLSIELPTLLQDAAETTAAASEATPRSFLRTLLSRERTKLSAWGTDRPRVSMSISMQPVAHSAADEKHFLYTPEFNLMVEAAATNGQIASEYEYLWFAGQPVAQIETASGAIHYYFNDHLGMPVLTTNTSGVVDWHVEREPYGKPYAQPSGAATRHQPLAFPGQEQSAAEWSYNIFRWYRAGWGRYSSVDPLAPGGPGHFKHGRMLRFTSPFAAARDRFMRENATVSNPALVGMPLMGRRPSPPGLSDATNPYAYAADSPVMYSDPLGLAPCLTYSINPTADYVPAGPPGKTFKGCQYIGECYGSIVVYEDSDVTLGCKCKQFCLMNIEPVSSIPIGPSHCFNMPPWWAWSPPLFSK